MDPTVTKAKQAAAPSLDEVRSRASAALEEVLEEANVSDLRSGLLPTIERLQENRAIKVVIRKHGKRRAVLMSAEAYDALMQVAKLFAQANDRLSPEERLEAAYRRMEAEGHAAPVEPEPTLAVSMVPFKGKETRILIEDAQEILRELDVRLGSNG